MGLIANIARTKTDDPIALLRTTISEVETNSAPVLDKSGKAELEPHLSRLGSTKRATANGPITLLNTTVTDAKSTRGSVLNESGIKAEPEEIKPENTTKKQSDNSESNTELTHFLPKGILRIAKASAVDEWESIEMRVTAYCPCPKCCGEYSDGVTACGHEIQPGDTFVAADRRYSFGTEMLIPGYSSSQPVKVLDRGGAIKGNRLDVFFATHQEALEWGVKYLEVNVRRKNL
jgi:3D (Asp-Asp-Asp) domain-containing protein